jgi:hypothetical protein
MPADRSNVTRSEIGGVIAIAADVDDVVGAGDGVGPASSAGAVHANSTDNKASAGRGQHGPRVRDTGFTMEYSL